MSFTAQQPNPLTAPVLASDIADRYANLIYYWQRRDGNGDGRHRRQSARVS
ncbi:hypothetical protein KIF59_23695 [Enterobacter cloacae subsp. cloacae]|nr:hypothetical protein [Enterobacter cloacae subsp. cloacae]